MKEREQVDEEECVMEQEDRRDRRRVDENYDAGEEDK